MVFEGKPFHILKNELKFYQSAFFTIILPYRRDVVIHYNSLDLWEDFICLLI